MPKFEDFKSCQKFGKFRQSWNKYKESILGKKHFLWRSSRYAKSKFDKPAEKNGKKPKLLAQGPKICNKIKLFKNVIYFFSSNVSSVESDCMFEISAAFFSLNVREVFTKLRKYLWKVTMRRRPLSTKISSRRVKSNFVELEEKTLPNL